MKKWQEEKERERRSQAVSASASPASPKALLQRQPATLCHLFCMATVDFARRLAQA